MPTYQYECSACGHQFEALQSMSEKRLKQCPECGQETLERLIGTGIGIIFKGSGFYETDYKRKNAGKNKSSEAAPGAAPCSNSCACHPHPSAKKN